MTLPAVWLLEEPWALFSTQQRQRIDGQLQYGEYPEFDVPGTGMACVALPAVIPKADVCFGSGMDPLPAISVPFDWNTERLQLYSLPACSQRAQDQLIDIVTPISFKWNQKIYSFNVRQRGCISRPGVENVTQETNDSSTPTIDPPGVVLQRFIDWQIDCFQEVLDIHHFQPHVLNSRTQDGVIRSTWGRCHDAWFRTNIDELEPARMSLIVKIAQDKRRGALLESMVRAPRVILERYRAPERIERIQELDAACIRWFARQPGRTAIQKSGPRQMLMAVRRRESIDTLENRVLKWCLEQCLLLAQRYLGQSRGMKNSKRCRDVRRLAAKLAMWLGQPQFADLSSKLPQPVQPNYQLQQHQKYKEAWKLYRELIRNQRVEDDAWRWQRILWKESCHQMFSAYLQHPINHDLLRPWQSSVYVREEIGKGRWMQVPRSPGPFELQNSTINFIDPTDGAIPAEWALLPGGIGADLTLVRTARTGQFEHITAVWFHLELSKEFEVEPLVQRCRIAVDKRRDELLQYHDIRAPMDGLLITNQPARETVGSTVDVHEDRASESTIVAVQLPQDIHNHVEDTRAAFALVIDRLLNAAEAR